MKIERGVRSRRPNAQQPDRLESAEVASLTFRKVGNRFKAPAADDRIRLARPTPKKPHSTAGDCEVSADGRALPVAQLHDG